MFLQDVFVGKKFVSQKYLISLNEILAFAKMYDPQPFHLDEELASQHEIFQGLAASGWHTAAIVMRLWTECMPIAKGLIGTDSHIHWPCPTRAGDSIHVEVEITNIRPSKSRPDRAIVTYHTKALNQDNKVVFFSDTNIVMFKNPTLSE